MRRTIKFTSDWGNPDREGGLFKAGTFLSIREDVALGFVEAGFAELTSEKEPRRPRQAPKYKVTRPGTRLTKAQIRELVWSRVTPSDPAALDAEVRR